MKKTALCLITLLLFLSGCSTPAVKPSPRPDLQLPLPRVLYSKIPCDIRTVGIYKDGQICFQYADGEYTWVPKNKKR